MYALNFAARPARVAAAAATSEKYQLPSEKLGQCWLLPDTCDTYLCSHACVCVCVLIQISRSREQILVSQSAAEMLDKYLRQIIT